MLERLRLQLRRLRMRATFSDHNYYHESCSPNERKRYRLRRRVYSSPSLRRRCTYVSSSNDSALDPGDLYWIQSPRARAKTFTTHNQRSNFINVDMDRDRPRGFWRSIFRSEYFDVFQRRKETRPRYEEERPRRMPSRERYIYTRPVVPRYRDEYRWEGPTINPPRRAPSPPLARTFRRRGVSLPRRVVRPRSPEPLLRPLSDEFPRRDIRRPQGSVSTRPRARPARPSSPVNERVPIRRGRRISPFPPPAPTSRPAPGLGPGPRPSLRPEVTIIQRIPRAISPQAQPYTSSQPGPSRPQHAEILSHNSIRERRKRIHSPETTSPPRSRKVRFVEGHEEIDGPPVYFNSDSDSSLDSSSDSGSHRRPGSSSSRASIQPRPRSISRPPVVVVVQPRRENSARIVERRPGVSSSWAGGELRGSELNGGVMRGPYRGQGREQQRVGSEGVMYEYREPRGQGRTRDYRRYV
jgi:hypothetical protein